MTFKNIASKATFQLKKGAGYVQGFTVVSVGSSWTIQVFDSTNYGTPDNPILGATAMAMPAAGTHVKLDTHFSNGLILVSGGTTAGELVVTFYWLWREVAGPWGVSPSL